MRRSQLFWETPKQAGTKSDFQRQSPLKQNGPLWNEVSSPSLKVYKQEFMKQPCHRLKGQTAQPLKASQAQPGLCDSRESLLSTQAAVGSAAPASFLRLDIGQSMSRRLIEHLQGKQVAEAWVTA